MLDAIGVDLDRPNAARRALTHYAVDEKMIERLSGYADTRPVPDLPSDSESNQRITLSLAVSKTGSASKSKALSPAALPPDEPRRLVAPKLSEDGSARREAGPTVKIVTSATP